MHPVILASSSPRRKELLQFLQIPFTTVNTNVDESVASHLDPEQVVRELALRKAKAAAVDFPDSCVIGSDTVVAIDNEILGKPVDRNDASRMLMLLSGRTHCAYTGVALVQNDRFTVFAEKTHVTFWDLQEEELKTYLDSGEPFDKAGSYGIQGFGSLFVKKIDGDYFTVVGLPVSRLARELKAFTPNPVE